MNDTIKECFARNADLETEFRNQGFFFLPTVKPERKRFAHELSQYFGEELFYEELPPEWVTCFYRPDDAWQYQQRVSEAKKRSQE